MSTIPLVLKGSYKRYDVAPTPGAIPCAIELIRTRRQLEPALGHYDFTKVDEWLKKASDQSLPLILGVTPADCWGYDKSVPDDTPGEYIYFKDTGKYVWCPFENEPEYLKGLDAFLKALGKYDGKLSIQYRFGCGGEGTNGGYHNSAAPPITASTAIQITQMYKRYFPTSQGFAMTDSFDGMTEAMKDPKTGWMRCSLGSSWFDDGMAQIAHLLGPLGHRPSCLEYYGPSSNMPLANQQISRWKGSSIGDWNYPHDPASQQLFIEGTKLAK